MSENSVRRVVTGHDGDGRAVVTHDTLLPLVPTPAGASSHAMIWATTGLPVDNDDMSDGRDRQVGLTMRGGTVIRVLDMLPGRSSPMHRTSSLDYGIVIAGVIELELDDGAITRVEAGTVVVQRGTIHAWHNPSADVTARVAFVLLDARPATVDGEPLPVILPSAAKKN